MRVGIANSTEVDALWPKLVEKFQEAIDKCGDDISIADLWQMCRSGNAFLVCAMAGDEPVMGAVLQFQKWTRGPVLRCLILAGSDMPSWLSIWTDAVRKMMREGGATRFIFDGRDGWGCILEGSRKLRVTFEVEL